YRRLHVIIGDATLSQHATWLRMGMTALVLAMAEGGTAPRLTLDDPVAALQTISHDPGLRATVPLLEHTADGPVRRHWTGLQILRSYLDAARAY
ncbi:proteasome accessory factor PafA2, partial [Micrococcus luteus]|nr:proteasome accessory factor PafA2 [Micrococcus luteus]